MMRKGGRSHARQGALRLQQNASTVQAASYISCYCFHYPCLRDTQLGKMLTYRPQQQEP